ncbi:MAG TPA: hypothetical protein VFC46_05975, partial [Humisphaera sp.]|nr:hypothetical protein [Humisphaera sp.]
FDPSIGAIPKRDVSGPAFSSVVMGSIFARQGRILLTRKRPSKNRAKTNSARKPAPDWADL